MEKAKIMPVKKNKFYIQKFGVSNKKIKQSFGILSLLAFMILILINPSFYTESALKSLSLFATTVLPALFPFYFFSNLLTKIGGVEAISKLGKRPVNFLFRSQPCSAYALTMSLMSGYPIGSAIIGDLYSAKMIDTKQANSMFAFCSNCGAVFMLGTVGSAIFGNIKVGLVVMFSHYLSSILNGLIFRPKKNSNSIKINALLPNSAKESNTALKDSITTSTLSMLALGGFIVICGMLIDTITLSGLENFIYSTLQPESASILMTIIYGTFEMTRASIKANSVVSLQLATALASWAVSFGGISVILQSYSLMSESGVKLYQVIIKKLCQSIFAFTFAFLLGYVL